MGKLVEFNTSCASVFTQRAGVVALKRTDEVTPRVVAHLKHCRDTLVPLLQTLPEVQVEPARGGMYAFFKLDGFNDSLEVAKRMVAEAGGAQWELAAVAAAQEETTFGGSRTSAFSLEPDAAIVIDVTHATDAPGIDVKEAGKHELGSGPVITRGSTLNDGVFELLHAAAVREKIPFTVEASGRGTGTDADAVHLSRGGVPTGLVSIPIRYMHSPVELVQLEDVHACARLVAAAALSLTRETSFAR